MVLSSRQTLCGAVKRRRPKAETKEKGERLPAHLKAPTCRLPFLPDTPSFFAFTIQQLFFTLTVDGPAGRLCLLFFGGLSLSLCFQLSIPPSLFVANIRKRRVYLSFGPQPKPKPTGSYPTDPLHPKYRLRAANVTSKALLRMQRHDFVFFLLRPHVISRSLPVYQDQ